MDWDIEELEKLSLRDKLTDKITSVGGGDFRGMSKLEVEIWNECNRLIALIIIYYNMHLLSKLYEDACKRR